MKKKKEVKRKSSENPSKYCKGDNYHRKYKRWYLLGSMTNTVVCPFYVIYEEKL